MSSETLTGRRRFVTRIMRENSLFGAQTTMLVLQVERTYLRTYFTGSVQTETLTGWRDAHAGDLTVEGRPA